MSQSNALYRAIAVKKIKRRNITSKGKERKCQLRQRWRNDTYNLEVSADTALHCTKTAIWALGNQLVFMMVAAYCSHMLTTLPDSFPQECQWWSWQRRSQVTLKLLLLLFPPSGLTTGILYSVTPTACTLPQPHQPAILPSCTIPTCPQILPTWPHSILPSCGTHLPESPMNLPTPLSWDSCHFLFQPMQSSGYNWDKHFHC